LPSRAPLFNTRAIHIIPYTTRRSVSIYNENMYVDPEIIDALKRGAVPFLILFFTLSEYFYLATFFYFQDWLNYPAEGVTDPPERVFVVVEDRKGGQE